MSFMTLTFYGKNPQHLFGGKYDLVIFLQTKLAGVCLFHQCQIKLMVWYNRKQYYLGL